MQTTRQDPALTDQVAGTTRFDWAVAGASAWVFGGFLLDGWAHHNLTSTLESPFTPWHAVLYSGFVVLAAILVMPVLRHRRVSALPVGYRASLLGVGLFLAGGVLDMAWHVVFGIEVNLEAGLSPTHLLLITSGVLLFSGPLRAAWLGPHRGTAPLPAAISLVLTTSLVGFFAEFGSLFANPWPTGRGTIGLPAAEVVVPQEAAQTMGVASVLLQSVVIIGAILLILRRWHPPFGTATLLFTLGIAAGGVVHAYPAPIVATILAGIAADLLILRIQPAAERPARLRMVAFLIPVVLYAGYFLTLALTDQVVWPVELWAGSTLIAGGAGLLASYLVVPWPSGDAQHHATR